VIEKVTLNEIKQSPSVKGKWDVDKETGEERHDIPFAFYSVSCCWWTSFPEDLGKTEPAKTVRNTQHQDYASAQYGTKSKSNGISLPCCPHCSSLLLEAPLDKFIKSAEDNSEHYGSIELFTAAHHRNSDFCRCNWNDYNAD